MFKLYNFYQKKDIENQIKISNSLKALSALFLDHFLKYSGESLNMIPENPRRTYAFVCPGCLTVYHLFIWEIEEDVSKCNYCGIPLERVKTGGEK